MNDKKQVKLSRRRFLAVGAGSIGAIIGLGYLGLAGDFLNPPAAAAQPLQEVGKVSDFPLQTPTLVTYQGVGVKEGVFVTNLGSQGWLALDFHCTHLQCGVAWVGSANKYMCPCHGGQYNIQGDVVGGPPPRPLHRRKIVVDGDSVKVGGVIS